MNLEEYIIIENKEIKNKFFIKIDFNSKDEIELFILNENHNFKLNLDKELIKKIFRENSFNKGYSVAIFSIITTEFNEIVDLIAISSKTYNKLINQKKINEKNIRSGTIVSLYSGKEIIFLKTGYRLPFHYIAAILNNMYDLSKEIDKKKIYNSLFIIETKMEFLFNSNNIEKVNLFLEKDEEEICFRTRLKTKSNSIMKEIRIEKEYINKEKEYELILSELYNKDNLTFDYKNNLEIKFKNPRIKPFYCISFSKEDINDFKNFVENYLKELKEKLNR